VLPEGALREKHPRTTRCKVSTRRGGRR